jgi:hypothetical protein
VHLERLGDVAQNQRFHRLFAVLEEVTLDLDDARGHPQQGVVAALQALDEPARLLQVVLHGHVVGTVVGAPYQVGVLGVDPQPRRGLRVEFDPPLVVVLVDEDVGLDVAGRLRRHAGAGARVERADQVDHRRQLVALELEPAAHLLLVLLGQGLEVFSDQLQGGFAPGAVFSGQLAQLDQQALTQVARGDAGRVERLDPVQHRLHLGQLHVLVGHRSDDVLQRRGEVTVVVDAVDDGLGDRQVGRAEAAQAHLPEQVVLQRFGAALLAEEVLAIFAGCGGSDRCDAVVDVVPNGVHREFVRHHL